MPDGIVASTKKKRGDGPPLPSRWKETFVAYVRAKGTYHRAAEAAGISTRTVERYRQQDAEFDRQVREAREYHADLLEEKFTEQSESSDNPVGLIVRLKALRPAAYIERHAALQVTVNADLQPADALPILQRYLASDSGGLSSRTLAALADAGLTLTLDPHPDLPPAVR